LVPNPDYLFLSKSHEEAIAHLRYALSHGDGFVEITGEVGTGKTTLCRAFLEDIDPKSEVAYIFNPQLDAIELLKAINDELDIDSQANNIKDLIDALNTFLIEKKAQGKNVILLIDEAQNLSKEVLEQLRLLSNLETNTSKLLQIILVGQPELQKTLDSYELRQLRQRITLSWYLTPLSFQETREYIRHRINIAAKKTDDKFTDSAYRLIYKHSGGIPRLINILCDRALLTAFGFSRRKVTGTIAREAIKEINSRGKPPQKQWRKNLAFTGLFIAICAVVALVLMIFNPFASGPGTEGVENHTIKASASFASTSNTVTQSSQSIEDFLAKLSYRTSRFQSVKTVVALWHPVPHLNPYLNQIDDDTAFFQFAADQNNLQLLVLDHEWDLLKKLNLPAILEFSPPGAASPLYLLLVQQQDDRIVLKGGEKGDIFTTTVEDILPFWSGKALVLWKNFYNYQGDIPLDAPRESVFTLKMLLRDIGYKDIVMDSVYDPMTREIIEKIQRKHGIKVDGVVGARTKIVIYSEKKDLNIPSLQPAVSNPSTATVDTKYKE